MAVLPKPIATLAEALTLAATLDAFAAEFLAPFSDEPYPEGACERFLRQRFDAPQTVLVAARSEGSELLGVCLVGPFEEPLLLTRVPMVLVLHVVPPTRHRGMAGALLEAAERVLAARGLGPVHGRVGHNDDALISMGERWGFVRTWELMQRD